MCEAELQESISSASLYTSGCRYSDGGVAIRFLNALEFRSTFTMELPCGHRRDRSNATEMGNRLQPRTLPVPPPVRETPTSSAQAAPPSIAHWTVRPTGRVYGSYRKRWRMTFNDQKKL